MKRSEYSRPNRFQRAFIRHYVVTLLWCSTDCDGDPLDSRFNLSDIPLGVAKRIVTDCYRFWVMVDGDAIFDSVDSAELGGHNFALTRNHHGAGYWDGSWERSLGEKLTEASHKFGGFELYYGCNWE